VRRMLAIWIAALLTKLGLAEIVSFVSTFTSVTLSRVARHVGPIGAVIDVGASDGRWADEARRYFPASQFFLIEAQAIHEPRLRRFCKRHAWARFVIAAASDRAGEVWFDDSEPFGGQASVTRSQHANTATLAMRIDDVVRDNQLPGPYVIKLDTHGYEVPILAGAEETLENTDMVIIETYNFPLTDQSLRFHEMVAFMEDRGFRVIDFSEPLWRKKDRAFWQFDLFFLRTTHPIFSHTAYK
jgi:FkbM family methyltransferase